MLFPLLNLLKTIHLRCEQIEISVEKTLVRQELQRYEALDRSWLQRHHDGFKLRRVRI